VKVLGLIEQYQSSLLAIGAAPPPAPRWDQDWFPRLDAAAAYAMVRSLRPRRIVEVGSGHSTRFLARAVADGGLDTRITAIDPLPRAAIEKLPVEWLRSPVQRVAAFPPLGENDILFIDSSHQLKPGSDVEFLIESDIFKVDFSSHAVVSRSPEKLSGVLARLPLIPGAIESSLWLTKL
jgi:hypothetical protein